MKNSYIPFVAMLVAVLFISSCEDELKLYEGPSEVHFPQSSDTYFVTSEESPYVIRVGVTNFVNMDKSVTISIDEANSTAVEGVDFTIQGLETIIQRGELFGEIQITGNFDNLSEPKVVVFHLNEGQGNAGFRQSFSLTLNQFCEYSRDALLGNYVNNSSFWGSGFPCEIVAGNAANEVIVRGMYPEVINGRDIVISIEQLGEVSYRANVARQPAFDANTPFFAADYGQLSIEGGGPLNTCGEFTLTMAFTVAAGSFGSFTETLVKVD